MPPRPVPERFSGTVNLVPGNYVALCFIPSPANEMKGHFKMGMVRPFTVVAASDNRVAPGAAFHGHAQRLQLHVFGADPGR